MSTKIKSSITTKTGDKGQTRLFSCELVSKNSPRLEAYGDLDELACVLGVVRFHIRNQELNAEILAIQRFLSTVAAELATTPEKLDKLKKRVDQESLRNFETKLEDLESRTPILSGFIVSGDHLGSSYLDLARTVARRCERKVVALAEKGLVKNEYLLIWLNRLSDYLYLMARFIEDKPQMVKE